MLLADVFRGYERLATTSYNTSSISTSNGSSGLNPLMDSAVHLYRHHPVRSLVRQRILQNPKILIKAYFYFD